MYVLKRMLILLVCVYCLKMSLFAEVYNDKEWPKLFSGEVLIVILDETGRYELKSEINDEKMINAKIIKQALENFVANGLRTNRTVTALDFEVNKRTLSCLNRTELEANG